MGYDVRITESTAYVPAVNLSRVYEKMCALNVTHDNIKHGGSWKGGACIARCFSWMDVNYPETCKDARDIFKMLGFLTNYDDHGNLHIIGYDDKSGQEDLFLKAIEDDAVGEIKWLGEDGEKWSTKFFGDEIIDCAPLCLIKR